MYLSNILRINLQKAKASEVLTAYLTQCKDPHWTSYFVKAADVENDQWGKSHFNWTLRSGKFFLFLIQCKFDFAAFQSSSILVLFCKLLVII